jgi:hypothetical protein
MLPATTYSSLAATGVDAASKIANPQIELIERKCQFPSFERYGRRFAGRPRYARASLNGLIVTGV